MKLMVGLGSIDDYEAYIEAGADEFFIGYVPGAWMDRFGEAAALNRREVLYYNVQIGSFSELLILKDMMAQYQVPVTVALNAIRFTDEQRECIPDIVRECMRVGITSFIVADEKLIHLLSERFGNQIELHISGEYGQLNQLVLKELEKTSVVRAIFPRQTTVEEMKHMRNACPNLELEAFLMNEKCHFTGAYCNSIHCDELCHACRIPYKLVGPDGEEQLADQEDSCVTGDTGCGLCKLWAYRDAGVTHLKIVSRGNDTDSTIADLRLIRRALTIMEESVSEDTYKTRMMAELFPDGCSHNCY